MDVSAETQLVREFAVAREWEQFHDPKNLVMALGGEVGELTALFQWLTSAQSRQVMEQEQSREEVLDEVADVAIYLLRLADVLDIDLGQAVVRKLEKNGDKYPVAAARGNARKYTDLAAEVER